MKNILYLSYTGMTDPLGQSQVLSYLKGLSNTGQYRFVIISFEKKDAFTQLSGKIRAFCDAHNIVWHPMPYTSKPPVISTFLDVRKMKHKAIKLHRQYQFSMVHCRSYISSLTGLFLKKKFNIPFLFDMRGFWADERVDGNLWNRSNTLYNELYKFFKRKEKQFLQHADHVISLTQNAKDEILGWKLIPAPAPIQVIPCCVDIDLFRPSSVLPDERKEVYKTLDVPEQSRVITYLGSIGTWYLLDEMMQFAQAFRDVYNDAYFVVYTAEPESKVIETANRQGYDTSFLRIRKLQRNDVPVYLSISTCSLFFIKPSYSKKASSPVKQGELMAMGIPIVCNDLVGDTSAIVERFCSGVVLKEFTAESFRKAAHDIVETSFDRMAIRAGAKQIFALEKGVEQYNLVYHKVMSASVNGSHESDIQVEQQL